VFARLPELGRVKTRLAAEIGRERASPSTKRCCATSSHPLTVIAGNRDRVPLAPTPAANGAALRRAFAQHAVAMQTGATLGDRLSMAFSERFFFHRTEKIVAIGVDDPLLPREIIDHAFAILDSVEYIVGPAEDGGYYLFGCRALSFEPSVFQDIAWGTSSVLSTTISRIATTGRTMALLRNDSISTRRAIWNGLPRRDMRASSQGSCTMARKDEG
jgi:rSAM/selenodomain-associated transferase 1